jgi:hypothetical protein
MTKFEELEAAYYAAKKAAEDAKKAARAAAADAYYACVVRDDTWVAWRAELKKQEENSND